MKYHEYKRKIEKLHNKLDRPPYSGAGKIGVLEDGTFFIRDEYLMPDEALVLAKWLIEFYSEEEDE